MKHSSICLSNLPDESPKRSCGARRHNESWASSGSNTLINALANARLVHAALPSNTLAVYGPGQTKELTELVPGILNQLGPDSLANLRRLAESYQSMTARQAAAAAAGSGATEKKEGEVGDDDEIPDLVENFEEAGEGKPTDLEELE